MVTISFRQILEQVFWKSTLVAPPGCDQSSVRYDDMDYEERKKWYRTWRTAHEKVIEKTIELVLDEVNHQSDSEIILVD